MELLNGEQTAQPTGTAWSWFHHHVDSCLQLRTTTPTPTTHVHGLRFYGNTRVKVVLASHNSKNKATECQRYFVCGKIIVCTCVQIHP